VFVCGDVQYLYSLQSRNRFHNLFAHGQLCVALSRVRQLEHDYIVNWSARKPIRSFNYDESTISVIKQLSELSHNE
jgi:hypothetical protein